MPSPSSLTVPFMQYAGEQASYSPRAALMMMVSPAAFCHTPSSSPIVQYGIGASSLRRKVLRWMASPSPSPF